MAIKNFKTFNESVEMSDEDKEELKWYLENGYIKDNKFENSNDLITFVKEHITEAFIKMAKRNKIPITNVRIDVDGGKPNEYYIRLYSDALTNFGVLKPCLKAANFSFFSGKKIECVEKNNHFLFKPTIWTTLCISYESRSGGSNGLDYNLDQGTQFEGNSLWYNILLDIFETKRESAIRHKPMLGSKKIAKMQDKTGLYSEDEESILPPVSLS